ncbi:5-oxoprolinase subunit PxpA [Flammeovirga aprica JL-4]|uniref:5-oxoprolinase subunit PxpA n=1 Tax=Flammeovirga aprica JL-4 TaxID=694437 RepID=A0A7X9P1D8_9BACT|nr:5-oxoprolinase subunit PxpA [Flammeovirga aprica JL-4]
MKTIDLNADLGEGFPYDEPLLQIVSSCNIACGGHTGTNESIRKTLQLARKYDVNVGAHPSYPDPENFGRKEMIIASEALKQSLIEQVQSILSIAEEENVTVSYVKPHGALYNKAMVDDDTANIVIEVIQSFSSSLSIMGIPNSILEKLCLENNISFIKESFADRRYTSDGKLVSRSNANAVIHTKTEVWQQIKSSVENGTIESIDGEIIHLKTDSICFHGDTPEALDLIQFVKKNLAENAITIKSFL